MLHYKLVSNSGARDTLSCRVHLEP